MAAVTTSEPEGPAEEGRDNLTRLLNLGRRRRVRVSRRHTAVVRGLRLVLPLLALGVVAVVAAWPRMDAPITPVPKKDLIPQNIGRNELIAPHFEGSTEDNNPYVITAARAVQSRENTGLVTLEKPVADIAMKNGKTMTLRAQNGTYRQDSRILSLAGDVVVANGAGMTLHSTTLNIAVDKKIAWTQDAVTGSGPAGTLRAKAMNANNMTGVVVLTGPAKLVIYPSGGGKAR